MQQFRGCEASVRKAMFGSEGSRTLPESNMVARGPDELGKVAGGQSGVGGQERDHELTVEEKYHKERTCAEPVEGIVALCPATT